MKHQPPYSGVPRSFAKSPAQHGLTISETAVLLGLLVVARKQDGQERFDISFKAGKTAMSEQRFLRATTAQAKEEATRAARNGFHIRMRQLKKLRPPQHIRVELTRTELLRHSGLSCDTRSLAKLDAILKKLRNLTVEGLPVPLSRIARLRSGRLRLDVAGDWIEPPFVRIPLPLPTRSLAAVNLSLFLRTINPDGMIRLETLCKHIGIEATLPSFVQRQAIHRALGAVNGTLFTRPPEFHVQHEHQQIPWFYKMLLNSGSRIRFLREHLPQEVVDYIYSLKPAERAPCFQRMITGQVARDMIQREGIRVRIKEPA